MRCIGYRAGDAGGVAASALRDGGIIALKGLGSYQLLVDACRTGRVFEHDEATVPVDDGVRGAAEVLGLDPFYLANEGRFVAFVPQALADRAVAVLRQ